ncbi:hypothetical protein C8J57DRAFT_1068625 [Mycena rebaudengoi]|nr:hypothetical protein C8J57DRAFT_1068625 [Mycena rebaudengoi]
MASTSQVMILVDDTAMQYAGANIWGPSPSAHWVGGNSSFAAGTANAGPFGAFNFTFQGTSVVFYGNTSPSDKAQTFTVAIDGDPPHPAAYPAPQQYRQWYASPPLSDATHTVSLDNMVFIDLDYAVVTAGPSTPLKGTTIIVDDNSPELIYSGKWIQNTNLFETGHGYAPGLPFQNAAHQSTTIGDSFTFQFAGTSIEVHGVFQWAVPGSVDATFVLDGTSTSLSFPPTPTKPLFDDQPNFMFFSASNLAAGNHTLAMNVTNVEGAQGFMFDYILYSPSFDSLALKPNFAATADPPSSKRAIPVALILACIVAGLVVICLVILYLFSATTEGFPAVFQRPFFPED